MSDSAICPPSNFSALNRDGGIFRDNHKMRARKNSDNVRYLRPLFSCVKTNVNSTCVSSLISIKSNHVS